MKVGLQVGLGPGNIVRWGPTSPSPKGAQPQFSAHICCDQMGAWIKISLGMELGLGPGDFVLDGVTADPLAILGAFLTLPGTKSSTSDSGSERS